MEGHAGAARRYRTADNPPGKAAGNKPGPPFKAIPPYLVSLHSKTYTTTLANHACESDSAFSFMGESRCSHSQAPPACCAAK